MLAKHSIDYYSEPSELLMEDCETIKGVIEQLIVPSLYPDEKRLEAVLTEIIKHPEMLKVIEDYCVIKINDNHELLSYTTDYTVDELSEMDGVWNTLGDVIEKSIREYFAQ